MSRLRFTALGLLASFSVLGAVQVANSAASAAPPEPGAGAVVSVPAVRVLDTRSGLGGSQLAPRATLHLTVAGSGGLPNSGVGAVVLNLTALRSTTNGYVTVWAGGASRPGTASLNFSTGRTAGNLVLTPVNAVDGTVDLYNGSDGTVQLVADVSGYVRSGTPSDAGAVVTVPPARLLDTRSGLGGAPLAARTELPVQVAGLGGVPRGVSAVVLNVTALRPSAGGYLTAWDGQTDRPDTANLNFSTGQTVGNLVVAPVSPDGIVDLYNGSSGPLQLVADVFAFVQPGTASVQGSVVSLPPARLLDTRSDLGGLPLAARTTLTLPVAGHGGVPSTGVAAVILNVTALRSSASGYVTVWAGLTDRPGTANLTFSLGRAVGNLVLAPVGTDGTINLYNGSAGTVDLVVDVFGYVRSDGGCDVVAAARQHRSC